MFKQVTRHAKVNCASCWYTITRSRFRHFLFTANFNKMFGKNSNKCVLVVCLSTRLLFLTISLFLRDYFFCCNFMSLNYV